jgi:hypothetical protein
MMKRAAERERRKNEKVPEPEPLLIDPEDKPEHLEPGKVCKKRPEPKEHGSGGGRPFVPWCKRT